MFKQLECLLQLIVLNEPKTFKTNRYVGVFEHGDQVERVQYTPETGRQGEGSVESNSSFLFSKKVNI